MQGSEMKGANIRRGKDMAEHSLRKRPKILLSNFSAEERKVLSDKIRSLGGIIYESSVSKDVFNKARWLVDYGVIVVDSSCRPTFFACTCFDFMPIFILQTLDAPKCDITVNAVHICARTKIYPSDRYYRNFQTTSLRSICYTPIIYYVEIGQPKVLLSKNGEFSGYKF